MNFFIQRPIFAMSIALVMILATASGILAMIADTMIPEAFAEDFQSRSEAFVPIVDRCIQMAEDFEFEGILKIAGELEAG